MAKRVSEHRDSFVSSQRRKVVRNHEIPDPENNPNTIESVLLLILAIGIAAVIITLLFDPFEEAILRILALAGY